MLTQAAWDAAPALKEAIERDEFAPLAGGIEQAVFRGIRDEGRARRDQAKGAQQQGDMGLPYRAAITGLGPKAEAFMGAAETCAFITALFGGQFVLTEGRSCQTVYGPGDHLGPHRDEPADLCQVTAILYLSVSRSETGPASAGLQLRVYGREAPQPNEAPRVVIQAEEGVLALGRGSEIWHERQTLGVGEEVIALTGCFQRIAEPAGERIAPA